MWFFGQVVIWVIIITHKRGKQLKAVRNQLAKKVPEKNTSILILDHR